MAKEFIVNLCCCNIDTCTADEEELNVAYLYAFDFDHTIVDENSDRAVTGVLSTPIPDNLVKLYDGTNWAEYMEKIFDWVGSAGGTCEVIAREIALLKATSGMEELLQKICSSRKIHEDSRFIIVSDANEFFIRTYLDTRIPPLIRRAFHLSLELDSRIVLI